MSASFIKAFLLFGFVMFVLAVIPINNLSKTEDQNCANSISCVSELSGKFEEGATEGAYMNKIVSIPQYIAKDTTSSLVLGNTTADKKIYIDLTAQHLYAFEDNTLIYDFPVSTGKWGATPTGTFTIWSKLRYTRMSGGSKALGTYYNLPNVPYTMFFHSKDVPKTRGFGIHGAYWHNNFGHPMSHGCINMKIEDVAKLYNWALPESTDTITYATTESPGTQITIYGQTPDE